MRVATAQRALQRHGYGQQRLVVWESGQPLIEHGTAWIPDTPFAHRLPLNAVVSGSRAANGKTILDAAREQAATVLSAGQIAEPALIGSSGVVITGAGHAILRLALGRARELLAAHRSGVEMLMRTDPDRSVARRLPLGLATGDVGLASWSLERRLPGRVAVAVAGEDLLDDCVEFLTGVHLAGRGMASPVDLRQSAEIIAGACPQDAAAIRRVANALATDLAEIPRGYAHGDFWTGNLLRDGGRLTGVVDWAAAGPGRLPLLDLFTLRVENLRLKFGLSPAQALLRYAAQDPLRDSAVRDYCQRIDIPLDRRCARRLLTANWFDRLARSLTDSIMEPGRIGTRAWRRANVDPVLAALTADAELTVA